MVVGIWFIDCPDIYERFQSAIGIASLSASARPVHIPIIDWHWNNVTFKDLVEHRNERRWFVMKPGVWFEMSNGDHRPMDLTDQRSLSALASSLLQLNVVN
jgi:hypothetical protein